MLVGNFGAPTRLSYTALGDGVNLAARLEPLCKQYGVVVLASEAIVVKAKGAFVFRRVDRCRELCAEPPPADWTGVHVARSK